MKIAVNMRKAVMCLLINKVGKLSMKSITETNSGKLISLISSEMFSVERGLTPLPVVISGPFTNVVCFLLIGF